MMNKNKWIKQLVCFEEFSFQHVTRSTNKITKWLAHRNIFGKLTLSKVIAIYPIREEDEWIDLLSC